LYDSETQISTDEQKNNDERRQGENKVAALTQLGKL
jgi:hypothetical protein